MRRIIRLRALLSLSTIALLGLVEAQNVGINVTGAPPNPSALLDLDVSGLPAAGKRGMLIPRLLRVNRLAIVAPPAGLWVYQTDDVTVPAFDPAEEHGFFYFEGPPTNAWVRWSTGRNAWTTTGNTGTTPVTNFLGTLTNVPLQFRTISPITVDPQMNFSPNNGWLGINRPPTAVGVVERLDVNGATRILSSGAGGGSATDLEGTIRFTGAAASPNRWHFGSTPTITRTGNTVVGSPIVTLTSTTGIVVGMNITATNNAVVNQPPPLPAGCTVLSITNATQITVSANAIAAGPGINSVFFGFTTAPGSWARMENAEDLVTAGGDYAKDTTVCAGLSPGFAVVGPLPGAPGGFNTTTNLQTPYPTNWTNLFPVACGPVIVLNGTAIAGNTVVTMPSTALLVVGMLVTQVSLTVLPPGTITIVAIVPNVSVTLSVGAAASGVGALSFAGTQAGPALSTTWAAPFVGATGRGYRTQYIYTAAELSAAGFCPGFITQLGFFSLDDDCSSGGNPAFTQGSLNVEVRVGHTALNTFAAAWDNTVRTSAQLNWNVPSIGASTVVQAGWNMMPLTVNPLFPNGFLWDGIQNIIVDFSWLKSAANARSPRVWSANTVFARARVGRSGASGTAGWNYTDVPVNPGGLGLLNDANRPVTRFACNTKSPSSVAATAPYINYEGGVMLGNAAWAGTAPNYRGPGTVHARSGVYDGNLQLNDHVFDRYFDGAVKPEEVEQSATFTHVPLNELKPYLARERHLPNLPSRTEWNAEGMPSVGELQNGLWRSVETQALYITELERDLGSLERIVFGDAISPEESTKIREEIEHSPRLSEQQKLHLLTALNERTNKQ